MLPIVSLSLVLFFYFYAGHLTWWRMLLTDPKASECSITAAVRAGTLPVAVYLFFVAFWLPLLVLGWTTHKLA
jgi:cytochrome c oxidase assembly factor CtaG